MNRLYGSIILFLLYFSSNAQVTFDQLPRDLQLFPRDASNQAEVVVSGKINSAGYTKIGVQVLREGVLTKAVSQTIAPTDNNASFRLAPAIKAERAEYSFRVILYKGTDSTIIAERTSILCGDVYIIHGQSNALALPDIADLYSFNFDDKYMRTATIPYPGTPADISWFPAKRPTGSVGGFGLTLQRLILENYNIPTCIINGAVGGAPIDLLSARDPNNHANPSTFYGSLLYRAQWAGVAKQAKAIIWKQGEAESASQSPAYAGKFTTLYKQFREDYGDVRIYVGQINILYNPQDSAAALRDFQRRTKYLYNNVETIATVGTPGYDGVHYSGIAHQQLAFEQFRLIARDFYGSKDTLQINSPDIKKAFYNTRKDSITLVFDDQMQMVWKGDTTIYDPQTKAKIVTRYMKDYFSLDGNPWWVMTGAASENRIILSLIAPARAKTIRYLPAFFFDDVSAYYDGPTLRNTRGMRAFSFDGVPIAEALPAVTTLAAKPISEKQIQLSWTALAAGQSLILERADGTPVTFKKIASMAGTIASYTDTNLPDPLGTYYYRLRVYNSVSESPSSNIVSARPLVLGLEPNEPLVQLYPNPLSTDRMLHVTADQIAFTDLLMRDMLGRVVKTWRGTAKNTLSITLNDLEAGAYVAELQTTNGRTVRRKVVIR